MPTKDKRKIAVTERLRHFVAEITKQFTTSVEEIWQRVERKLGRAEQPDKSSEDRQDSR
jgi:hypothetical protein